MKILITANSAWNILNFRRPLVEAMMKDGHKVIVLSGLDDSVEELEALGCSFRSIEIDSKGTNPLIDARLQSSFGRVLQEERPDAVLSFTIKNNIFGARAAKKEGIPFLPTITGLGTAFLSGFILQNIAEALYRWSFSAAPVVFFQNRDDLELFVDRRIIRADQAQLIPGSGIDLERFAPVEMPALGAPPIFLLIGRILRDKGVMEFVGAARQLKARNPNLRFQLLGSIGSENRTAIDTKTVDGWVSEGVIEYLGATLDVRPAISASSCIVLPSYREGAPRALIEAAAMARPLIATDVPGCRSVVDSGVSGYLCASHSSESLAEAIEHFLAIPPALQRAMGLAGRAKMEREFDQVLVVNSYREALSKLVPHH